MTCSSKFEVYFQYIEVLYSFVILLRYYSKMLNSENSASFAKEETYAGSTPNVSTPSSDPEQLSTELNGEAQRTQLPPRTVNGISVYPPLCYPLHKVTSY